MRYLLLLLLLLNVSLSKAQITIGKTDSLYSEILKEKRQLWIYVPDAAASNTSSRFPVIYLLDGEIYFHSLTGEVSHLSEINGNAIIPDMIVVGIVNINRARDLPSTEDTSSVRPNGAGERFTSFIEKELIPYIETHYPTAPYRMLVGHSLGGLFVMNTLLNHAPLFDSYICLDPSLQWDQKKLLLSSSGLLSRQVFDNKSLFLGGSSLCLTSNAEFDSILKATKPSGLRWSSKYYPQDSHGSVPLIGSYDGLRFIFDFYKRPTFTTITDTTLRVLTRHYENVSKKMGYTILPSENLLLGLAWRCRALEKNYERAGQFLEQAERSYPESIEVLTAFSDLCTDEGESDKAKMYRQKSKELAERKK